MAREQQFARLLSLVAREVTVRQASDVCCGDLTLVQFQTLEAISASGRPSLGTLSTELRVDLSTMSRNVSVLERNGYLARSRSAEDGRIVHVGLTAKGRGALATLRCGERDVLEDIYRRLAPSERPQVLKALESLRACFEDEVGAAGGCCLPDAVGKGAS